MKQPERYPSPEEILAKRTPKGGFKKADLAEWGIEWPPPHGWILLLNAKYEAQQKRLARDGQD